MVFARGRGSFPCDLSALEMISALNWTHRQGLLEDPPSAVLDDGAVVYYCDEEEVAKELTDVVCSSKIAAAVLRPRA